MDAPKTTKEILKDYHKIVPFPLTIQKIQRKGRKPFEYLTEIAQALSKASDANDPSTKKVLDTLSELGAL